MSATEIATALGSLERCGDVKLLRGTAPPPANAAAAVRALRMELAGAKALEESGKLQAATAHLSEILAKARELHYRPLIAESLYQLGTVVAANSNGQAAEQYLTEAVSEAQACLHDEVMIEAMVALVSARGYLQRDLTGADLWHRLAEASLDRIGGHDRLRARELDSWATALAVARRSDDALKIYEAALSRKQKALGATHVDSDRPSATLRCATQFSNGPIVSAPAGTMGGSPGLVWRPDGRLHTTAQAGATGTSGAESPALAEVGPEGPSPAVSCQGPSSTDEPLLGKIVSSVVDPGSHGSSSG